MNWEKWQELMAVEKPIRYVGREWNIIQKEPDEVRVAWALSFPDVYEVGMSHLGLKILYHLINSHPHLAAERVFAPWRDREQQLRARGGLLHTLESRRPLCEFDIVGFSLQHELSYTNVLNMLDLGGIPLRGEERKGLPLIVGGGPGAFNPEPLADFFDCFFIGEGEEMVEPFSRTVARAKNENWSRGKLLKRLAHQPGIYVPSLYRAEQKGQFFCPVPRDNAPARVEKQLVHSLEESFFPEKFVVPYTTAVHDRVILEVARGCSRGCRFCHAGMIYRPVRERSLENLKEQAHRLLRTTGYSEISLLSLSTTDHSQIEDLVQYFSGAYQEIGVGLALPSLRLDSFCVELARQVQTVRKTGLTFAPEAGTQRLRNVINKGINHEDLMEAVSAAFRSGWTSVKLYFMIGLPTETDEDVQAIGELAREVWKRGKETAPRRPRITVSVATFVPKPHTPFQWEPVLPLSEITRKQKLLQKMLRGKQFELSWHGGESTRLEGILARGDRSLGPSIYQAWKSGARFDSWSEEFDPDLWSEVLKEGGWVDRGIALDQNLPWDHIFTGVEKSFLQKERHRSREASTTADCRGARCHGCGCCGNLKALVQIFGGEKP